MSNFLDFQTMKHQDFFPTHLDTALAVSQVLKDEGYWVLGLKDGVTELAVQSNRRKYGFDFFTVNDYFLKTGIFIMGTIGVKSFQRAMMHCIQAIENSTDGINRAVIFGKKFEDDYSYHKIKDLKSQAFSDYPVQIRSLKITGCGTCQVI